MSDDEMVSRLKFIGKIQKDEKIDVKNVARQPDGFWTRISRSFINPDNRRNTLKFLRDIILESSRIGNDLLKAGIEDNAENVKLCKNLLEDLINARNGILNIKYTYSMDTIYCCELDILLNRLDSEANKLKEKLTPTE